MIAQQSPLCYTKQRLGKLALAISIAFAPCISMSQDLPDIAGTGAITLDLQQEYEMGRDILSQIRTSLPVIDDTLISHYINSLGSKLVTAADNSHFPFTFLVIDDPAINAFATPGGIIVVHSGLVQAAANESELAAVLAHEVSHVTQRHIARMFEESGGQNIAAILGMIAAALLVAHSPAAAQASLYTGMAVASNEQLEFSRDNEREADRAGKTVLVEAGYDSLAMSRFFKKLQESSMVSPDETLEFLQTHPSPQSRISDTWNLDSQSSDGTVDSQTFQLFKARTTALSRVSNTQTSLNNYDAKVYAEALAYYQNKQPQRTLNSLTALKHNETRFASLLKAQALIMKGEDRLAISLLERLNSQYPNDPAVIELKAQVHLIMDKPQQAVELLRTHSLEEDPWLPLLRTKAKAEAQIGRQLNSHETLARYYQATGHLKLAIEHIKLAINLAPPKSIALARLRTQEENLSALLREKQPNS